MKILKITIISVFCLSYFCSVSQVSSSKYYIELTDKNYNTYSINKPHEFLSDRAVQRRINQNINIEERDLPVTQIYIDSLENLGLNVLLKSKWFNAVTVETSDSLLMDTITNLSFVNNSVKLLSVSEDDNETDNNEEDETDDKEISGVEKKSMTIVRYNYYDYGDSENQVYFHSGQKLHDNGYRGKGMLIAITDTGFDRVPSISSFDHLFAENRIIKTGNFVYGGEDVYNEHTHGTLVLSALAAIFPGYLIGTAPEAEYMLFITEDTRSETMIEELYWVSAAELSDSMGADLINVSLGYFKFDDSEFDYYYKDLNGKTAIISQAANIASQKGMIVVAAGGNSGRSKKNPHIGVPADADDIISVGAIRHNKEIATISSIGPTSDDRIKPDVVSIGIQTAVQHIKDSLSRGFGTSFAAPVICGLTACLWQKHPQKSNLEIIQAIKMSSSHYLNPDKYYGYGLPDFEIASHILENAVLYPQDIRIRIFPNPFYRKFSITYPDYMQNEKITVSVTDVSGRTIFTKKYLGYQTQSNTIEIGKLKDIKTGFYVLSILSNSGKFSQIIIKR